MDTRCVGFTGQKEKDRDACTSSDEERRLEWEYQRIGKRCPRSNFLLQFDIQREIYVVYGDAVILT